jgi:large conductance mechanosensitive channel
LRAPRRVAIIRPVMALPSKMLSQFREFAVKGNVVDMAVGIMIGAAFTTVVKTLVDEVLMPPIGMITGNIDFSDKYALLRDGTPPGPYDTLEKAKAAGAVTMGYGLLINALVSFTIVALVLFFIVRWVARLRSLHEHHQEKPPTTTTCAFCKSSVHIDATRCPQCTSELKPGAALT